ncbi:MAG: hypothetical protein H0W01_03710 [Pseudonocardiales bacterium]|nr:hypothetical protein [Pseudonocardiales bacterium]
MTQRDLSSAGVLPAGTRVVVEQPGERWSRVIDDRGLAVEVHTASLRPLPGSH